MTHEPYIDIAILDDDQDFRLYIADLLADEGIYSVRTFAHPAELYAACEQKLPHIVLLDMKMGEFTGAQVLDELQSRYPNLCVIIVTGYPSLEDMRNTFRRKVFDYLPKPFALAQLRQTLQSAAATFGLGKAPHEILRDKLGARVKFLRFERGWSLKDLAQATGLSTSQISSIERGAHLPSIESLLAISRAFDKKPSELLTSIDF